jgi:hypothetical protein
MPELEIVSSTGHRNGRFTATHWSVVLAARGGNSTRARAALESLCRSYWYPLYAFVRRMGQSPHDAEDSVLEEEIGNTVASPQEVEEERRYLLAVLSG